MIVDADYNVLSVIDWKKASTVPWEVVEFPLFLTSVLVPMNATWNHDERGLPKGRGVQQLWDERKESAQSVQKAEEHQKADRRLSTILASREVQNLVSAVKLYFDPGKIGFYCKALDCF
ncbi:hypothetical protein BBP40_011363 [Aspergillus hancockii]|nr:hypothetical protein BBP40_011363 [Aspergillus hancockii]